LRNVVLTCDEKTCLNWLTEAVPFNVTMESLSNSIVSDNNHAQHPTEPPATTLWLVHSIGKEDVVKHT